MPGPKSWQQLALLRRELQAYSPRLAALPALIVANKAETLARPNASLAALRGEAQAAGVGADTQVRLSAGWRLGCGRLKPLLPGGLALQRTPCSTAAPLARRS